MAVETVMKSSGIWWRKGKKGRKETFRPAVKGRKKKKKKKKFPVLSLVNAKGRQKKPKSRSLPPLVPPNPRQTDPFTPSLHHNGQWYSTRFGFSTGIVCFLGHVRSLLWSNSLLQAIVSTPRIGTGTARTGAHSQSPNPISSTGKEAHLLSLAACVPLLQQARRKTTPSLCLAWFSRCATWPANWPTRTPLFRTKRPSTEYTTMKRRRTCGLCC